MQKRKHEPQADQRGPCFSNGEQLLVVEVENMKRDVQADVSKRTKLEKGPEVVGELEGFALLRMRRIRGDADGLEGRELVDGQESPA